METNNFGIIQTILIPLFSALIGGMISFAGTYLGLRKEKEIREKERTDKFRLAAIDKRLEAHQKAYYHWYILKGRLNKLKKGTEADESLKLANSARDFWVENCLYLERSTRSGFTELLSRFYNHQSFQTSHEAGKDSAYNAANKETIAENLAWISTFGDIIQKDVFLEPIDLPSDWQQNKTS